MGRLGNSWQTVKASWNVLKQDKELLLFPVFSGIASLIVMASFVAPTYVFGYVDRAVNQDDPNAQYLLFGVYVVMYLVLSFITIYFNSALVFAANERLAGGDPTVGSGLRGANGRLGRIFAWSLFAGTVSLIIHLLENATRRSRGAGSLVANIVVQIVGVAWTLATFFAIPVVVFENKGVWASLKRSGALFKKTWGESVVGQFGIGWVFGLLGTLVVVGTIGVIVLLGGVSPILALVAIVNGLVLLALVVIVGQALGVVYKVALYRYATQGETAPYFQPTMIQNAYRPVGTAPTHW